MEECPICFEEESLVPFTCDSRHRACEECVLTLSKCPLCRRANIIEGSQICVDYYEGWWISRPKESLPKTVTATVREIQIRGECREVTLENKYIFSWGHGHTCGLRTYLLVPGGSIFSILRGQVRIWQHHRPRWRPVDTEPQHFPPWSTLGYSDIQDPRTGKTLWGAHLSDYGL
jgi:hypothetical protein